MSCNLSHMQTMAVAPSVRMIAKMSKAHWCKSIAKLIFSSKFLIPIHRSQISSDVYFELTVVIALCHSDMTLCNVYIFMTCVLITAEPIYMNTQELAAKIAAKRKSEQDNSDTSSTDTTPTGMTNSIAPAPVTKKEEIKVRYDELNVLGLYITNSWCLNMCVCHT